MAHELQNSTSVDEPEARKPVTPTERTQRPNQEAREASPVLPGITLPKGGGSIRGVDEKFAVNPATGAASLSVPIPVPPSRSGFSPALSLSYDSSAGNGPFGFGWRLSVPRITRRTEIKLPQYRDEDESDVFVLSDAEDLTPELDGAGQRIIQTRTVRGRSYRIKPYRPRVEGLYARIELWIDIDTNRSFWRLISGGNVTSWFGYRADANGRIADPADSDLRTCSWLLDTTFDDNGNLALYDYAVEDSKSIPPELFELNRAGGAARYPQLIRYGNRTAYYPDYSPAGPPEVFPSTTDWMFQVVFDYGDHNPAAPQVQPDTIWPARPDPFSDYRSGFEVRTYRLCRRILMFHQFAELGRAPVLVRSTDLVYRHDLLPADARNPNYAMVVQIFESSYVRTGAGYLKRSLPPLELEFIEPVVDETVRYVDTDSLEGMAGGAGPPLYQWIDLYREGSPGLLSEEGDAWIFKRNISNFPRDAAAVTARFEPPALVATAPARPALSAAAQIVDLEGDGRLRLVQFRQPVAGYYELDDEGRWDPFLPFPSQPNVDWDDPNVRILDLDGDGRADLLIAEDLVFTWYASAGRDGFTNAETATRLFDEERGPSLVFTDPRSAVLLADMSGDGLSDVVRIRDGEICYWPNLGYGRFGGKVTMPGSPMAEYPEQFDPKRIRLADVDGTGTSDLMYLGDEEVRLYFNRSGNSWSEPHVLTEFSAPDSVTRVEVLDFLGTGTACLVWSSPLLSDVRQPVRYVDLMSGQKPHLLSAVRNNFGLETRIHYRASTHFFLQDYYAGHPWITSLPFPVHVVERSETYDRVSRSRFVSRFAYHHGYYDGEEREFRGFGAVEQFDTDELGSVTETDSDSAASNVDAASYVPPVVTRSCFHTGSYNQAAELERHYRDREYYALDPAAITLDSSSLPDGLSTAEQREAVRALKGLMLRQEVYALDGSPQSAHPFSVSQRNCTIARLQPIGTARHAVFAVHDRESVTYNYERDHADPRVTHQLTLEVDEFGNVLEAASLAYGRRKTVLPDAGDAARQSLTMATYHENRVTPAADTSDAHRTPQPYESIVWEITGLTYTEASHPAVDALRTVIQNAGRVPFETKPLAAINARTLEQSRTLYWKDDLTGPMPLGQVTPRALNYETYRMAFTPGLVQSVFLATGKLTAAGFPGVLQDEGGYVAAETYKTLGYFPASDADGTWWAPSGQISHSPVPKAPPPPALPAPIPQNLAFARQNFFLPQALRDPFGNISRVTYDASMLLLVEIEDALENIIAAVNDYRLLQPATTTDINGNQTSVAFDILGLVAEYAAVMGKAGEGKGDSLAGLIADLSPAQLTAFLKDPVGTAAGLLGSATTRIVYDPERYQRAGLPGYAATIARETHVSDLAGGEATRLQISFGYGDGLGRTVQTKTRTEDGTGAQRAPGNPADPDHPGPLLVAGGVPLIGPCSPRWIGSGRTIYNNKAQPVRQYEPFFSSTHLFEDESEVAETGVTPVLMYDAIGRRVATLRPDHTFEKTLFNSWRLESWDVNDTLLIADPSTDLDVGYFFQRLPAAAYLPGWNALRASGALGPKEQALALKVAVHANTPDLSHFDSLGRGFLSVAHNKLKYSDTPAASPPVEEFQETRVTLDITGKQVAIIDARNRIVMRYDYDLLGSRLHQESMEAGSRWILHDTAGKPIYAWDSRDHQFHTVYDALRRPTDVHLREGAGVEFLTGRTVYGETRPGPEVKNLRGKVVEVRDQAGVVTTEDYDFKGNPLSGRRQFAQSYNTTLDWSGVTPLDTVVYVSRTRFDALNREIQVIAPHSEAAGAKVNVIQPVYNEASLLKQVDAWLNQGSEPAGVLSAGTASLHAITDIAYDARGQRALVHFGNGVRSAFRYDPQTFRLANLHTWTGTHAFQDLNYIYDPVGNVTRIEDDAQETIYFRNKVVDANAEYTYDALYRLIEATGREHLGQAGSAPSPTGYNDGPPVRIPFAFDDGSAMASYLERYIYDVAGNFGSMKHIGTDPASPGWTRGYAYQEPSLLEPGKTSNRLTSTATDPMNPEIYSTAGDGYDGHGNMLRMPQLQEMRWDFKDQLRMTRRQKVNASDTDGGLHQGERTWYVYDSGGQRVRKVTERGANVVKEDRIYFGGFEVFRGTGVNAVKRETLHIIDGSKRIALVETRAQGTEPGVPAQLIRYQFGNHLGSSSLELDDLGAVMSYEEYTAYGSTSYRAVRSQTQTPKRYRFTGKERDEESGLYSHGARYCAQWLGRWTSCDPIGVNDGLNIYAYCHNNPITFSDPHGTDDTNTTDPNAQLIANALGFGSPTDNPKVIDLTSKTPPGKELERRAKDPGDTLPGPQAAPPPKQEEKSWLRQQSTGVGFYRPPTPGDLITPVAVNDTGNTALNLSVNAYLTLSNLVAAGINTVGNIGHVGEEGAKAAGFSDTEIQAFKDLTGAGELNVALAAAQEANAIKALATTAKADLISSQAALVLSETSAGADAAGELKLATNLRTTFEFGHNASGGTVGTVTEGFHQVGNAALSENALLHQLQVAKGGFPTAVQAFTFQRAATGGQYSILSLPASAENAARAIGWGRLLASNPQLLGDYSIFSNSCTTVSIEILQAGRLSPAIWARGPATLQLWFRLRGGQ